jgi:hypothetical protein
MGTTAIDTISVQNSPRGNVLAGLSWGGTQPTAIQYQLDDVTAGTLSPWYDCPGVYLAGSFLGAPVIGPFVQTTALIVNFRVTSTPAVGDSSPSNPTGPPWVQRFFHAMGFR